MGVLLFVVSTAFFQQAQAQGSTVICSGHPDYKPFMWQHGDVIVGAGAELIRTVFEDMKKPYTIKYKGPWARVQEMVQRNKVDFLVGAYDNATRREYMVYLDAYALDPTSVFVRKDGLFSFSNRNDLIGKKGVSMHGDSFGDDLDAFIKDKLKISRVYDSKTLFKRLVSGQMDYILWGDFPCEINAAMEDIDREIQKLYPPLVMAKMHITVSKKSRFVGLVPQMNRIIKQMESSGRIKKMLDKYMRLYVGSSKVDGKREKDRPVTLAFDPSCDINRDVVLKGTSQVWPGAKIKTLETGSDVSDLIAGNDKVVVTSLSGLKNRRDIEWLAMNDTCGLAYSRNLNENILALWQLQVEALINTGAYSLSASGQ